jgi:uncharacterized protein
MSRTLSAAVVLGLALVAAALVFGLFFYHARTPQRTVQVVGAATRQFDTDVARWRVTLSRGVGLDGLSAGYSALHQDVERVAAQLRALGVPDSGLIVQPASANPRYERDGQMTGYDVNQTLLAVSHDVDALERLALDPGQLDTGGAFLQGSSLEYFYDGLAELKHALLAEATADARRRAEQIAGEGNVDAMTEASAGVFQITQPYSTDVEAYGIHDTSSRQQQITVTVRATFTTG